MTNGMTSRYSDSPHQNRQSTTDRVAVAPSRSPTGDFEHERGGEGQFADGDDYHHEIRAFLLLTATPIGSPNSSFQSG